MAAGKGQRWGLIALVVLVVLIAGGIVGFRVAGLDAATVKSPKTTAAMLLFIDVQPLLPSLEEVREVPPGDGLARSPGAIAAVQGPGEPRAPPVRERARVSPPRAGRLLADAPRAGVRAALAAQ